jgi:hypothetical protein
MCCFGSFSPETIKNLLPRLFVEPVDVPITTGDNEDIHPDVTLIQLVVPPLPVSNRTEQIYDGGC